MSHTEQMREALIRRMDAYLNGQSAEATAIIKDAHAALTQPAQPASQEQALKPLNGMSKEAAMEWLENLRRPPELEQQPSGHIKEPYSVAEIKAKIASGDYSAEMLLQHAMLHLAQQPSGGEVAAWMYDFAIDGEVLRNWTTSDYSEIESHKPQVLNVRPLTLATPKPEP